MMVFKRSSALGLLSLIALGLPATALAQTSSDAGALQQQINKDLKNNFTPNATPAPIIEESKSKKTTSDALKITVKGFSFEGNNLLKNEELDKVVKPYLNKSLTFSELQDVAGVVAGAYRAKGFVVRSFLPKQDVLDGIIRIKIIESKFGKTRIEGDSGVRLQEDWIEKIVSAQQKNGEPVNTNKLDRALLLIDDLPGIGASGRLQEGEAAGETDIVVKRTSEALATGAVITDNQGSRSTGDKRIHAFTQVLSPFGFGEQSSAYVMAARGLAFARLEQTFPVGHDGWRVGGNASIMRYDVIPHEFQSLDGKGSSASLGLQASYPLIREREKNLYLSCTYDHRYLNNDSQGVHSSNYQVDNYTMSLNANKLDKFGGGGSSNASVAMSVGALDRGAIDNGEDPEVAGAFRKFTYSVSRQQALNPVLSLYAMVSGQVSPDNKLDSSEMFYLGGPSGVRAYPVSEGSGVEGHIINAEVRWRFLPNYQASVFYDHGYVHNSGSIKSYSLDGAGVGLAWQSSSGFNISASWAHRIGDNPNPASNGEDQDGSSDQNRYWLTISKRF